MIEQLRQNVERLRSELTMILSMVRVFPGTLQLLGTLQRVHQGAAYDVGLFVRLGHDTDHPILTSTSWDGDAYSTTAATVLDLATVFSVPAGVKAVLLRVRVQDSGAAGGNYYFSCGQDETASTGFVTKSRGNSEFGYGFAPVPCDPDGNLWYSIQASGAGTLAVVLSIHGYWI